MVDISKPHPNLSRSERITIVVEKSWIIGNDFKRIDGEFFKYIGSKINEILVGQNVIDVKSVINTGITWSFRWKQPTTIEARSSMFPKGILWERIFTTRI